LLVGADCKGGAGAWTAGALPVRTGSCALPVRGFGGEGSWKSVRPLAASSRRTGRAAIASGHSADDPREGGAVARRLADVAQRAGTSSIEALQEALLDGGDVLATSVLPVLVRALGSSEVDRDPELSRVAAMVRAWDGSRADDPGAAVYAVALQHVLPQDLFPESRFGPLARMPDIGWRAAARIAVADASPWFPDAASRDRALVSAIGRAAQWLRVAAGPDPSAWRWRSAVDGRRRHLLWAQESFAVEAEVGDGAPFAVRRIGLRAGELPFAVRLAACARVAADLSTDELRVVLAGGASGRVGTPHFADLIEDFHAARHRTLRLTTDVKGDLTELISG
jgi:acyl-homoserine lactone acylase PvdQ